METTAKVPAVTAAARFFRVLSDPTRVAILRLLAKGPHSVGELVEATGVAQSRVSTHLACLRWCEFVTAERSGRRVVYSLADPEVGQLLDRGLELSERRLDHLLSCTRIGPAWV